MPLVLTQNESTESGHVYADELGVAYEYPTVYRRKIQRGETFVYYRGRRRATGGHQPQVYLGAGIVGEITPSPEPDRLICAVEHFRPFAAPVPFKLNGDYLEPLGKVPPRKAGLHFRQGVRSIDDWTYNRILRVAAALDATGATNSQLESMPYAPPQTAQLVDEIAMELALAHLTKTHAPVPPERMPHNNPGFDIRLSDETGHRYFEVKGTTRAVPHFFMSEGERLFAEAHADTYALVIVHAIDLASRTGQIMIRDGSIASPGLTLRPVQWEGTVDPAPEPEI